MDVRDGPETHICAGLTGAGHRLALAPEPVPAAPKSCPGSMNQAHVRETRGIIISINA